MHHRDCFHKGLLIFGLGLLLVGLNVNSPIARAEGEEAALSQLEEIVVTARKREENLQDTPVAVSAFSTKRMEEEGLFNIADFNAAVPGIEVKAGNGVAGVANIYIRGVGQRNTEPNLDSGVGIYLDGVYISRADGALLDMNDVQSMQVVRGPQGTLFGKNTTGGALVITTTRPGPDYEGKALVRVGNFDRLDGQFALNIPLIEDTLFTRLSLSSVNRDGYMKNVSDGEHYNDDGRFGAIWQLRWLPSDTLTVDLNTSYARTRQRPRGQQCKVIPGTTGWQVSLQDPVLQAATGKGAVDHCMESSKEALGTYRFRGNLGGHYTAENFGAGLTANWDFADTLSIKSISAWRRTEAGQNDDLEALDIPLLDRTTDKHPFAKDRLTDQYSQELQLTGSAFDERLQYVAGVYGFLEKTRRSRTVSFNGPFIFPGGSPTATTLFYKPLSTGMETDNKTYAVFGQADWNFSESWRLTGGLRYTWESRTLTRTNYTVDVPTLSTGSVSDFGNGIYLLGGPFNPDHGFVVGVQPFAQQKDTVTDSAFTPMVSLQYLYGDRGWVNGGSTYLTYSRGFRSGGLSEAVTGKMGVFKPELVDSFELGVKFDAWENRLRMNAALFYAKYSNRQLTSLVVSPTGGIGGATINARDSNIRGIELETSLIPVDDLELTINGTWSKGEIKDFADTMIRLNTGDPNCTPDTAGRVESCAIDRSDEDLPRLPDWTVFVAVQYTFRTDMGSIIPRAQFSKKWGIERCFDRTSCVSGIWNNSEKDISARLSWVPSADESWMVSLYANNLTNEHYIIGGNPFGDNMGFGGTVISEPRMYGAEIRYRWQ